MNKSYKPETCSFRRVLLSRLFYGKMFDPGSIGTPLRSHDLIIGGCAKKADDERTHVKLHEKNSTPTTQDFQSKKYFFCISNRPHWSQSHVSCVLSQAVQYYCGGGFQASTQQKHGGQQCCISVKAFGAECLSGLVAGGEKQAEFIIGRSASTQMSRAAGGLLTRESDPSVLDAYKREYVRGALEKANGDIGRALDVSFTRRRYYTHCCRCCLFYSRCPPDPSFSW